jgi:hypothetical protein
VPEKRINVWVQSFPDRDNLLLQWFDPIAKKRKSKSAGTADPDAAEDARADHEYELNHGVYQEASRITWEGFRKLFEQEFVAGKRENTRRNYRNTLDIFEQLCNPARPSSVTERTLSAFVTGMRKTPTRGRPGMMPSSIKVHLQFLRTTLRWAVDQKILPARSSPRSRCREKIRSRSPWKPSSDWWPRPPTR